MLSPLEDDKELEKHGYTQKLSRSMGLWSLVSFGLMYLQPIGPAVVFGYLLNTSGGTVALPYLVAFVGMLFTISSYSTLIKQYPLTGSVYNYAKIVISPFWGFITGWIMALDYILIPTITSVSAAIYAHQLAPVISYESWLFIFVVSTALLNIRGIKCATYFGLLMLLIQIGIVVAALILCANQVSAGGYNNLFSLRPFHFQSYTALFQASGLAIFSFLGFDAITTLAEEAVIPTKSVPSAMLICSLIGFIIMFLTGYLGVLVLPNWGFLASDSIWQSAALFNVAKLTGGSSFALLYGIGFILAMVVSNLVGTTAAARLLYGMGRDGAISKRLFSSIHPHWKTPYGGIIFIAFIELFLGSCAEQDQLAELINFGAIGGFVLLNMTVLKIGYNSLIGKIGIENNASTKGYFKLIIFPLIGIVIMTTIFFHMKNITIVSGLSWAIVGAIYYSIVNQKSTLNNYH